MSSAGTGAALTGLARTQLGHDHERRDLHQAENAGAVNEPLHQTLDHLWLWSRLLQLNEYCDVRRLEQAEREDGHHAYDDKARDNPSVQRTGREDGAQLDSELPASR